MKMASMMKPRCEGLVNKPRRKIWRQKEREKVRKKKKNSLWEKEGRVEKKNTKTNNFKNMIFWGQTLKNHNQSPESVKQMTYKRQSEWVKKDHH
jgi:hypothetical protein